MSIEINDTHDPARRSWVESANAPDTDFPIQNLPFGRFLHIEQDEVGAGVALGDRIIDLRALARTGALSEASSALAQWMGFEFGLEGLLGQTPDAISALRAELSDLFRDGGTGDPALLRGALVPQSAVQMLLPLKPTAFTDFCTSIDHIKRMAQGAAPLAAMSLPVAYNGRASSVVASGTPIVRPLGQFASPPGSNSVSFGPEPMLDFELEFGVWLRDGNALGKPLTMSAAEDAMFGCCLVNDWSARGIQFFESILGPHLGKSFATTISPWIVTMEALAPFRVPGRGRAGDEPDVPAHLLDAADRSHGGIAIELTAELAGKRIVRTNLEELFWTLAQMVAHQASNGSPLEPGDLVATGTVSGAAEEARACLAEITFRGGASIDLPDGSKRDWLEDGDTLTLRGRAMADGFVSIGFGDCSGTIQPARMLA